MRTPQSYKDRAQLLIDARRGVGDPDLIQRIAAQDKLISGINDFGRRRRFAIKLQQKLDRALESYVRSNLTDWDPNASEDERKKFNKEVEQLITQARTVIGKARALKNKAATGPEGDADRAAADEILLTSDVDKDLLEIVELTDNSRAPADNLRNSSELRMIRIAKGLPAASWIESVRGVGLKGFALVLSEAAAFDNKAERVVGLDGYPNPAKLWKRLGYAPYDGHAGSTWKREKWRKRKLTSEEWIANPFSGPRYATCQDLSVHLVDHQCISTKKSGTEFGQPTGPYGEIYVARRIRTAAEHPDWSKEHARKDALRIAFKQFLVDLWKVWVDQAYNLGQWVVDAQDTHAEIAAAGQGPVDTHSQSASGGTKSRKWNGHRTGNAHFMIAETAAPKSKRRGAKETRL
jgi:hypothetical protein